MSEALRLRLDSESEVSSPSRPSPCSMRVRILLSELEIATTLSITSSPEASRASTLVGFAAGMGPPSGMRS